MRSRHLCGTRATRGRDQVPTTHVARDAVGSEHCSSGRCPIGGITSRIVRCIGTRQPFAGRSDWELAHCIHAGQNLAMLQAAQGLRGPHTFEPHAARRDARTTKATRGLNRVMIHFVLYKGRYRRVECSVVSVSTLVAGQNSDFFYKNAIDGHGRNSWDHISYSCTT